MSVKVDWPKIVALVHTRLKETPGDWKGEPEMEDAAYRLGFSREEIILGTVDLSEKNDSGRVIALDHTFECNVAGSYYLPFVFARPLEGKMMPKGILGIRLDGELVLTGDISSFLPDLEPVHCLKPREWMKTKELLRAHTMLATGAADASTQIGFMMPNQTKARIELSNLHVEEKVSLEVGFLAAYYSTKKSEVTI